MIGVAYPSPTISNNLVNTGYKRISIRIGYHSEELSGLTQGSLRIVTFVRKIGRYLSCTRTILVLLYACSMGVGMHYLTKDELRQLFQVAYTRNRRYHLALVTALWHGMRVSELNNLRGSDITPDGKLIVRRLKGSNESLQPIRRDVDPLFDESPIIELARERKTLRLFEVSRQHFDRLIKMYGAEAGIHPDKLHMHALKHSIAMLLWDATTNVGQIQSYLGHKAVSSTLCYLYEADARKAQTALAGITL